MIRGLAGMIAALALAACGPDLQGLSAGEDAVAGETQGPTRLALADGRSVFLAEIYAPEGADYQAQEALAGLTAGRPVRLAFGPRQSLPLRGGQEALLAHVFVRSEGGRWLWVQGELVEAGLVLVRPRPGEAARAAALLALEARARDARRGIWDEAAHQPRSVEVLAVEEPLLPDSCRRGDFRLLEGIVDHVAETGSGVYLNFGAPGAEQQDVTVRIAQDDAAAWAGQGFDAVGLAGAAVRARGPVGVRGGPLLCLEHPAAMERLEALP